MGVSERELNEAHGLVAGNQCQEWWGEIWVTPQPFKKEFLVFPSVRRWKVKTLPLLEESQIVVVFEGQGFRWLKTSTVMFAQSTRRLFRDGDEACSR